MNNELNTWDRTIEEYGALIKTPKEMVEFFDEIKTICKKYNLSISHVDGYGGFIIERYDEDNINWLRNAMKCYK